MIYFNEDKQAFAFEIPDYIAVTDDTTWAMYAGTDKWDIVDGEFVDITDTPEYQEEQTEKRRTDFYDNFLATSLGNYRLKPKGYANAQQSIDTVNNIVMAFGGLTEQVAQMVIFYRTPDFTKEEECTEDWLVAHQYNPEPMTREQWLQYYVEFTQKYAAAQYKKQNAQSSNIG